MARLTIQVLVADDYEPLRRFVSSTLKKLPQLQLVGEASDGLAALRKAQELKPEIMLLDIRLPELNGFEVARQIREHIPQRIGFEPLKPLSHKLSTPSSAPEKIACGIAGGGCGGWDKLTVHSQRDTLAAHGDRNMNHEEARSRVKEIAENASGKQDVDDKTWNDLIEIGNWTKAHAPYPALLEKAIPQRDSQRTWMRVRHSAETIVKALA